jgi:uncharacterized membrane protein YfcA
MDLMIDFSVPQGFAISLTFFLAGIIKGVTGMGLPTFAMGVLGTMMPPVGAAALLIIPSFVTNIWQLAAGSSFRPLISRLWLMMLGITLGTIAASWLLTNDAAGWTRMALGMALIVYASFTLLAWQVFVPARAESWLSPLVGLTTGLITGGTGVFVIPAVPYLQALSLNKEDLIQALGLSFTVSTIALAIGLAGGGALHVGGTITSALAVAPSLAGMWVGQNVRQRISPTTFRRCFLSCLLILGLHLVLRPFL